MMDYGLIFTIIGAAWLAKSLMQAFERMEKGTKKTAQLRQTTARSVTQGNHESIIIILHPSRIRNREEGNIWTNYKSNARLVIPFYPMQCCGMIG